MSASPENLFVAIACGGTGGHLYPGLAVAGELQRLGCDLLLLVSPKEVDQQAVRHVRGMAVATLPAVALQGGRRLAFVRGFWASRRAARKLFRQRRPRAVLAMGGFTSAPPLLAGRRVGACTFIHESNTIPGRANRWLAHFVDEAFVGFPDTVNRLWLQRIAVTGTPVREQFQPGEAAAARMALGLDVRDPVVLVMGGSQGAASINDLVTAALPQFRAQFPSAQFIHLTGVGEAERVRAAYAAHQIRAVVQPFLTEIELALGAATLAITRAGASTLAELAAMRIPAVLIPFPHATDDHQFHNARAVAGSGAARLLAQAHATPATLAQLAIDLLRDEGERERMSHALEAWHHPHAAADIARRILRSLGVFAADLPKDGETVWTPPARFNARQRTAAAAVTRLLPASAPAVHES